MMWGWMPASKMICRIENIIIGTKESQQYGKILCVNDSVHEG